MTDERAFTASLARWFAVPCRRVTIGIGDDAAVVRNAGSQSVLACDPVVEGVHFAPDAPLLRVGHKAVHRNLSDLAAMGARPDFLLVSLLWPASRSAAQRRALMTGLRRAAAAAGCAVVGGDVAGTPGPLTVTVTAIGHLVGPRPLTRKAARAGDAIHVTGPLGGASLGGHLRFAAALDEGAWLARHAPPVAACIDVSDGLLLDLHRVLRASGGLGAALDATAIPLAPAARRLGRRSGRAPLEHALGDGEDHALLFTVRRGAELARGGPLTAAARRPIGVVTRQPGLRLRAADGSMRPLSPEGYQHEL